MPAVFRALGSRNYALYWSGALLSNIGSWMQTVALGWLVLQLTNSPFWVGFVSFAGLSPSLLLSLFGGVIADRMDRRRLLIATQTALLLSSGILATLTALGVVTVAEIIVLSFLSGLAGALNTPAQQAMIADLVSSDILLNAISLNSVQFNLARIAGPALAGVVISWVSTAACFYLNSLSFVALIGALFYIRVEPRRPLPVRSFWRHLGEGLLYVRGHAVLRLILATASVISIFCLPYIVLMPVFARDVLHVGADGLGYLMASAGVGAVVGGLGLAAFGNVRDKARLALRAGISLSFAVCVFALSSHVYLSIGMLLLAGGSMVTCIATLNTLLQLTAEPSMRGRVLSMYALALFGFTPLGSLQAGTLAHLIGTPDAVALGSAICFVFLAVALTRVHRIGTAHWETLPEEHDAIASEPAAAPD